HTAHHKQQQPPCGLGSSTHAVALPSVAALARINANGDGGPPALLLRAERVRQTRASASATDRHEVLSPKRRLPLRKVPGEHGPPLLGALKDRLEYLNGPASARTAPRWCASTCP
uniref:Uncharacterized protein n=1 Tax=Triticum urartu TaxID=4572 RepID=A0A8R7TEE0_TRIUA